MFLMREVQVRRDGRASSLHRPPRVSGATRTVAATAVSYGGDSGGVSTPPPHGRGDVHLATNRTSLSGSPRANALNETYSNRAGTTPRPSTRWWRATAPPVVQLTTSNLKVGNFERSGIFYISTTPPWRPFADN